MSQAENRPPDPHKDHTAEIPLSLRDHRQLSEQEYQDLLKREGEFWGGEVQVQRSALRRFLGRLGLEPTGTEYRGFGRFTLRMIHGLSWYNSFFKYLRGRNRVFELGCGGGFFSLELARRNPQAVIDAADIAPKALADAAAYYEKDKLKRNAIGVIRYHHLDINRMEIKENEYDAVVALASMHHMMHIEEVIGKIKAMLKPGGLLLVMDENETTPRDDRRAALLLSPILFPVYLWKKRKFPKFDDLVTLTHKLYEWRYIRGTPFEEVTEGADLLPLLKEHFEIVDLRTGRCLIDPITRSMNILNKFIVGAPLKVVDNLICWSGFLSGRSLFVVARNRK